VLILSLFAIVIATGIFLSDGAIVKRFQNRDLQHMSGRWLIYHDGMRMVIDFWVSGLDA